MNIHLKHNIIGLDLGIPKRYMKNLRHKNVRLVQRNVRDMSGVLIPPWKAYDELRPGMLVLMKVTFYCLRPEDIGGKKKVVPVVCSLPSGCC